MAPDRTRRAARMNGAFGHHNQHREREGRREGGREGGMRNIGEGVPAMVAFSVSLSAAVSWLPSETLYAACGGVNGGVGSLAVLTGRWDRLALLGMATEGKCPV